MSNFIIRTYKDIETCQNIHFEDLAKHHKYILKEKDENDNEKEIEHLSNIAIILGEPASGKTYQLNEYHETHSDTHFVELINLKDTDTIETNIQVVLIDSIDEALV